MCFGIRRPSAIRVLLIVRQAVGRFQLFITAGSTVAIPGIRYAPKESFVFLPDHVH